MSHQPTYEIILRRYINPMTGGTYWTARLSTDTKERTEGATILCALEGLSDVLPTLNGEAIRHGQN